MLYQGWRSHVAEALDKDQTPPRFEETLDIMIEHYRRGHIES
jgi:hypothetical protein